MLRAKCARLALALVCGTAVALAACISSGPQKTLETVANALDQKDTSLFFAQVDLKKFASNQIRNMTQKDTVLNSLDSLGRMLGLGGMEELFGSVMDMEHRLQKKFSREVATGELVLHCRSSQQPDCPWVPASLRQAKVKELSPSAAIAKVTTPTNVTSWLALQQRGEIWAIVGQAVMEDAACAYALETPPAAAPEHSATQPAPPASTAEDKVTEL